MLDGLETVILLIGLYLLFLVVWSVASIAMLLNQRRRIRDLEGQVAALARAAAQPQPAAPATEAAPAPSVSEPPPEAPIEEPEPEPAQAPAPEPEEPAGQEPPTDQPAEEAAATAAGTPEEAPGEIAEEERHAAFAGAGDLETRIGGKLFVWLGAVALALAGGFLVKYSIDEGLLTPARRVIGGYLLGFVMLGVGHRLARSSGRIGTAVLAAGIASLYAASYAAGSLYGLVSPPVAFAILVAVTTAAELLALRHGRLIAHVGLAGGYLTPILVGSPDPNVPLLFGYLFLLTFGLGFVGTRKPWPDLCIIAVIAAYAWSILWLIAGWDPAEAPVAALYLLALTALATGFGLAAGRQILPLGIGGVRPFLVRGAAIGGGVLLIALVQQGDYDPILVAALWLYAAAALAFGRYHQHWVEVAGIGTALALLGIADWTWPTWDWQTETELAPPTGAVTLHLLFAATWALGGGAAVFGARRPGIWASIATVPVVILGTIAYAKALLGIGDVGWAYLALAAAAGYAAAAAGWARYRLPDPESDPVLAATVTASAGLIALAVSLLVTEAWVGMAWSLTVLAMGLVSVRLRVPALRVLAAVLAGFAGLAVTLEADGSLDLPAGFGAFADAVVRTGLPTAALAAAAIALLRRGEDLWAQFVQAMAAVLGALFVYIAIRSWFPMPVQPGVDWNGWELGLIVVLIAAYALGLGWLATRRRGRLGGRLLPWIASAAGLLALAVIAYGALQVLPMGGAEPVGETPITNALILLYAIPAALAWPLARQVLAPLSERWRRLRPWLGGGAALLLAFGFVTLEVRQVFHAPRLFPGAVETGELYAYSAVWLAFALAMFFAGIVWTSRPLRAAGLGVMTLALAKVFLWDAAALDGLWRVASFLGLGISLLLIAWLFQRFVGRNRE